MAFKPRAESEAHPVKTGETLDSLASANSLTTKELELYNWGTQKPTEINIHLYQDVGCRKPKGDADPVDPNANYQFNDNDKTFGSGTILIPKKYRCPALPIDNTHVLRLKSAIPTQEAWPVDLKGKLFWNRTWNYNDETVPIPAVKEYLPGAKAELLIQKKGEGALSSHQEVFLTDDGEFKFTKVPEMTKAAIKITLQYKDDKIVCAKGKKIGANDKFKDDADYKVHTGKFIWHQMDVDVSKVDGLIKEFDLGDLDIKKAGFVDVCDAYKTVWFGHKWILDKTELDLPICQINYPEDPSLTVSNAGEQMQLCNDDLKDRDVILHEYGHFIGTQVLGGLTHPGYGYASKYNKDTGKQAGQHGPHTEEHYEAAWNEGHATFLSCAITDDPHYHDGYDTNLNMHLDTDEIKVGPHCEGSIQCALWRIYKVHGTDFKAGFWKAFTDSSKRKVRSIFDLHANWKDLGLASLDKVEESFKHFNMEFGYHYNDGAGMFGAVAAPKTFDAGKKEFQTIDELQTNFGSTGGGTLAAYKEEFFNRNKFKAFIDPIPLGPGSSFTTPKLVTGNKYITPERFKVG